MRANVPTTLQISVIGANGRQSLTSLHSDRLLGCADPVDTIGTTDNPGREQAAALFAAWPQGQTSYTTAELIEIAEQRGQSTDLLNPELLSALQPIGKDRRGSLDAGTLGNWLRDHKDTVIGTLKLRRHGSKTRPSWGVARPSRT